VCRRTRPHSRDTPGVIAAEANFATDEAQVRYNPADTSLDALYDAIEDAGYRRSVKTATAVNRVKMLETLHDRVRFENSSV